MNSAKGKEKNTRRYFNWKLCSCFKGHRRGAGRARGGGGHWGQPSHVIHKDMSSPAAAARESVLAEQPHHSSQTVFLPLPAKSSSREVSCGAMLDQNLHLPPSELLLAALLQSESAGKTQDLSPERLPAQETANCRGWPLA